MSMTSLAQVIDAIALKIERGRDAGPASLREWHAALLHHLTQPAQSVDEMVLVPVEPTQAMLEAMAESYWGETWNAPGMGDDRLIDARNMYDEALTAALREPDRG